MIETVATTIWIMTATLGGESQLQGTYTTQLQCEQHRPQNTRVEYTCERDEVLTQYECGRPVMVARTGFWGNTRLEHVGEGCQQRYSDGDYGQLWRKIHYYK